MKDMTFKQKLIIFILLVVAAEGAFIGYQASRAKVISCGERWYTVREIEAETCRELGVFYEQKATIRQWFKDRMFRVMSGCIPEGRPGTNIIAGHETRGSKGFVVWKVRLAEIGEIAGADKDLSFEERFLKDVNQKYDAALKYDFNAMTVSLLNTEESVPLQPDRVYMVYLDAKGGVKSFKVHQPTDALKDVHPKVQGGFQAFIAGQADKKSEEVAYLKPSENTALCDAIKAAEAKTPRPRMTRPGLVGAMGGVNLKAHQAGRYEVRIPLPQMTKHQIPVAYHFKVMPESAFSVCRLDERDRMKLDAKADGTFSALLSLVVAQGQEVAINWSAAILVRDGPPLRHRFVWEGFSKATACVQAGHPDIKALAKKLWPASYKMKDYAAAIQAHIRAMQQKKRPMSLDALGILDSGMNTICTANANLACALMRARDIPCRSMATLPTLSWRFEMHRIVEYFDQGSWVPFDPSSVYADIPLKPWQNIIMAKTSIADEEAAMKPRYGVMRGAPFGHEAEFTKPGLSLHGQHFFWTVAAPLAEFKVNPEASSKATGLWWRFLQTGKLEKAHHKAASARTSSGLLKAMEVKP